MIRLVELDESHIDAVYELDTETNPSPWTRSLFVGELSLEPSTRAWIVAHDSERVVGFAGVTIADDDAHLMAIAVEAPYRRRGIAKQLFDRIGGEAVARGAINLTLEVREQNLGAIALYEEMGMHSVGKRPKYYSDGTDAVIMWFYDIDRVFEAATPVKESHDV